MTHTPKIVAEKSAPIFRTRSNQMRSSTKQSAPKINMDVMDDAKIDECISAMPVMIISSHDLAHFLSITGRRSGHVHTRNRHEIEHATHGPTGARI